MRRKIARRAASILFGLFVAVLTAEIAARMLVAQDVIPSRMPADLFAAHEIGWTLQPNLTAKIPSTGGLIAIDVNGVGFRDDDYPTSRVDGVKRVLVLGDSFTLALETPQEQTFHARLEDRYAGQVEVIAMAASGYETVQEYLAYQYIGRAFDPDVVLLMFYVGNDPVGNRTWANQPYYTLDGSGTLTLHQFPHTGGFDLPLVVGQRSTPLMRRSVVAFMLGNMARRKQQATALETDNCGYLIAENYPNPGPDDWTLTEALILALRDAVEADGKLFRLAIIPTEFQIEQTSLDNFMADCQPPDWADNLQLQAHLTAFLEANDIAYLDLAPILREAAASSDAPLYLPGDDIHWTPEGHAEAANALYDWLGLGE